MTESSKTKKILKQTSSILFYVLSGLLITFILMEIIIPKSTIKVFQFKPYVVITESMEPVLNVDDMIIVYNPNLDKLDKGDIITFEADINYDGTKEVITHYIDSITLDSQDERVYRTIRHDGVAPDSWILRDDDIIGVYGFRIPKLGVLVTFLRSPFGIAAVAVNIVIIIGIVILVKSGKKESNKI